MAVTLRHVHIGHQPRLVVSAREVGLRHGE